MINLDQITKDEITSKGGEVLFDWWLEQVGNTVVWNMKAFLNGSNIKLSVSNYDNFKRVHISKS
jgi:hypothetical protein